MSISDMGKDMDVPTDKLNAEKSLAAMSKLRWRCRRGMLELDVLLNQFLDTGYGILCEKQRNDFDRFLDYPDQVLHDLLLEKMNSTDIAIAEIIKMVRKTAIQ